jgi:MFS family permease
VNPPLPATRVRFAVLGVTTLAAALMYLDRVFLAEVVKSATFKADFALTDSQLGSILSAFFFAYALAQVPAGWLSDRFGARKLMSLYIALWSGFTVLTASATSFGMLVMSRIGCGLAQAGAYPTSSSLLTRWAVREWRGVASSVVSVGGRLGGAVAPVVTVLLIAHFGNWRWPGWIYGAVGLLVAWLFWRVFHEAPREHPHCNEAERALLAPADAAAPSKPAAAREPFPIGAMLASRGLGLMCLYQFFTNVGWAFLVTWMARYLKDTKHLSDETSGLVTTLSLFLGIGGLLVGGVLTDLCTRRLGARLGRLIPLAGTRFVAALAYLAALWCESPWALAAVFGLVACATDMGLPATWAYIQDVGGRHVAPIFGWANMCGNLGAALAPKLLPWVNAGWDRNGDWQEALLVCAGAFLLSGVMALGINAALPVVRAREQ